MEKQKKVNRFLTLILAMVVSVLCLGIMGAALRANTYQAYAKQAVGAAAKVAEGVYNGSAQGFKGIVKVAVTVKDHKITAVDVKSNQDTPAFFNRAKEGVIPSIIKSQSADVDAVSGATYSSNGIKNAVKDALK
ncbi:MAG: FMN-binding protein [Oscillospiraceae bacterium]|nr:FMN-binding protein [Oscillospiraceae bacterium]